MHDTAHSIGRRVLEQYTRAGSLVIDVGAFNYNGTLRHFSSTESHYIGIDLVPGPDVDIVVQASGPFPFPDEIADLIVTTSTFEHDQFFWETFLHLARLLKKGGILYLNSPSNGKFHRYPRDYWRFYPDCGFALEAWANKNGQPLVLLESFIALRQSDIWNDFVALFVKEDLSRHTPLHFISDQFPVSSAWCLGRPNVIVDKKFLVEDIPNEFLVEDMHIIQRLQSEVADLKAALRQYNSVRPLDRTVGRAADQPAAGSPLRSLVEVMSIRPSEQPVRHETDRTNTQLAPSAHAIRRHLEEAMRSRG